LIRTIVLFPFRSTPLPSIVPFIPFHSTAFYYIHLFTYRHDTISQHHLPFLHYTTRFLLHIDYYRFHHSLPRLHCSATNSGITRFYGRCSTIDRHLYYLPMPDVGALFYLQPPPCGDTDTISIPEPTTVRYSVRDHAIRAAFYNLRAPATCNYRPAVYYTGLHYRHRTHTGYGVPTPYITCGVTLGRGAYTPAPNRYGPHLPLRYHSFTRLRCNRYRRAVLDVTTTQPSLRLRYSSTITYHRFSVRIRFVIRSILTYPYHLPSGGYDLHYRHLPVLFRYCSLPVRTTTYDTVFYTVIPFHAYHHHIHLSIALPLPHSTTDSFTHRAIRTVSFTAALITTTISLRPARSSTDFPALPYHIPTDTVPFSALQDPHTCIYWVFDCAFYSTIPFTVHRCLPFTVRYHLPAAFYHRTCSTCVVACTVTHHFCFVDHISCRRTYHFPSVRCDFLPFHF